MFFVNNFRRKNKHKRVQAIIRIDRLKDYIKTISDLGTCFPIEIDEYSFQFFIVQTQLIVIKYAYNEQLKILSCRLYDTSVFQKSTRQFGSFNRFVNSSVIKRNTSTYSSILVFERA